uniref:Abscisate beta-glucosyltransferase-like n=1 Tax=Populus alba TaxID=43335 RepID=A0A4U5QCD0_POPAL|nr:abscisate beta-glucosyltransferase-like [Populus alba]
MSSLHIPKFGTYKVEGSLSLVPAKLSSKSIPSATMDLNSPPVEMFFFPFVGGAHQVPMIDIARVFASHGAKATIITTPKHSLSFQTSIHRDQECGLPISIHALELSDNVDVADTDMSANSYTDTSMLQEPLQNLLLERKPDCIVHDVFHRWSADAIDSAGIPRITFNGNGCFAHCVRENMERYKPHEKVTSDLEPFIVSGLPDGIELTTSQLPFLGRPPNGGGLHKRMPGSDEKSFGVMVNSFYELETAYVDSFRNELGKRDRFHYAIEMWKIRLA